MSNQTYFNLHTHGIGYLSNIRTIEPRKGDAFLACTVGALMGESGNGAKPEYRYFDCKVVGKTAIDLVNQATAAVEANKKVLISFVLADLWTDTFVYQKDGKNHKKGDVGVMLKSRLIRIKSLKVDGVLKYQEPAKNSDSQDEAAPSIESNRVETSQDTPFESVPDKSQPKQRYDSWGPEF